MSTAAVRVCPTCNSTNHTLFANNSIKANKINNFTYASRKEPEYMCYELLRCNTCDLVFAASPPGENVLVAAYSDSDYDSNAEANDAAATYSRLLSPLIKNIVSRGMAIDIGAGNGALIPFLKSQGFKKVVGVEPSRAAINSASNDVRSHLVNGAFSRSLFDGENASLVCAFMVLEHVPNPRRLIKDCFEVLEDGGVLAVVVHDWRALINRVLGMSSPIIDIEHLQLFSRRSLRALLMREGFESIRFIAMWNTYPLGYWIRLTPLPNSIKSIFLEILRKLRLIDFKVSIPVGNFMAISRKSGKEGQR